jgi:hypothetical protein
VQASAHVPPTQYGAEVVQVAFDVHIVPGFGMHTPLFEQVDPVGQPEPDVAPPEQLGRHLPSSQTSPLGHWLVYVQMLEVGSQEPATHVSPLEQSLLVVHGQGPLVPPQVTQAFL